MVGGSFKREFGAPFSPILHACTEDLGRDWFSWGVKEFDPLPPCDLVLLIEPYRLPIIKELRALLVDFLHFVTL